MGIAFLLLFYGAQYNKNVGKLQTVFYENPAGHSLILISGC